jgi:hypothetical protein
MRKLHNEELHHLFQYHCADQIKENEVGVVCGTLVRVYKVLEGMLEGKRRLGRPGTRRKNGISLDLKETG